MGNMLDSVTPADYDHGAAYPRLPPTPAMGSLSTWRREDGTVGIEGTPGPLIEISLQLLMQQHDGPRFIHLRDGVITITGHDRAGTPVELRYRAVGLQLAEPDRLAADEGGSLLLELLPPPG